MNPHNHSLEIGAVSVGAMVSLGELLARAEPILGSISYIAAICVAVVTIYYKIKKKG